MPKQYKTPSIAIIGGGYSGAMLAVQLIKQAKSPLEINIISKSPNIGRGAAYSTTDENHLLNVPALNMSAYPDDSNHFLKWLEKNDYFPNPAIYYPRKLYGDYIESQFATIKDKVNVINASAVNLSTDNEDIIIELSNGEKLITQYATLAIGNFPPITPDSQKALFQLSNKIIHNPWADLSRLHKIDKNAEILIIGAGLTMVDVTTTLFKNRHQGKITVISRNGKLQEPHIKNKPKYDIKIPDDKSVLKLLKFLRKEIKQAEQNNIPWQAVFDSLRPHTQSLWQRLPLTEKRRFMRHVRIWWDTRRHRMSETIYENIQDKIAEKKLFIRAARLLHINPLNEQFEVVFKPRGSKTPVVTRTYDFIINCVTPETNLEEVNDPLVRSLLAKDIIRSGTLRMGLKVNDKGAVIGKGDYASPNIFAIGPIQKGELWETIAVPELRVQAQKLAQTLLESIEGSTAARQGAGI